MARRESRFSQQVLVDTTPMPDHIPKVEEIGATSAPLFSAAYFIGDRCRAYNDDFMKCKAEANGRGELECLKEGRKVTRCAASVIKDINTHCLKQFTAHWECLEQNNHRLFDCRKAEVNLNACVFDKLGLKKTIPGAPEDQTPVHLRPQQIFSRYPGRQWQANEDGTPILDKN
ncbi:coiled-coil-helix-coiled-coil-helix domain-containing protein [Aspergillus aculeatinus CBS 121060]|uniref:NADH-ubiquinone oxidoreductase n=7 Tax=Aspergillus TaxID=5052 RepID=A0A319CQV8_9EURO|nr:NADH dehydrogenase, alpha subcomplex, subunit 8 [Aspergillus brunneoviolaceus CBS 621.78]XP_025497230.1 NADH dehydrogenase, alpha subcomplex, subunit 8 [Aspergillus uvarum CBS 121591]XP_025499547.1 NADH dehydrogenase, alpha subcomplex, subunit 8 [Aspergillus aculeatinus CBS 121060]XP_025523907.1 NADH dehydrogenase, alpha subcomplex, subunit 8 [Aspergillus japonicus CBS 114.51]XP_040803478.1 NADH dehydrogenase, alpha subcomplex, subunit 8 [Aspergillus fijiensis CBS 313.89]PYI16480.1 NADH deh